MVGFSTSHGQLNRIYIYIYIEERFLKVTVTVTWLQCGFGFFFLAYISFGCGPSLDCTVGMEFCQGFFVGWLGSSGFEESRFCGLVGFDCWCFAVFEFVWFLFVQCMHVGVPLHPLRNMALRATPSSSKAWCCRIWRCWHHNRPADFALVDPQFADFLWCACNRFAAEFE